MTIINMKSKGLSTTDKITRARHLIKTLAENPEYSNHPTPISQISAATDALEQAYSDLHALRQMALSKTSLLHEREGALDIILQMLESDLDGQAEKTQPSRPTTAADAEPQASASLQDYEGGFKIESNWGKVRNLRSYLIGQSQEGFPAPRLSSK
jgi:hypothetical protein